MSADVTSSEGFFAIVPDYIYDADISAQAIRLYIVLRRFADNNTMQAHPTRATLAERLKVKDEKVVDRAAKELVTLGALEVVARWRDTEGEVTYARDDRHRFQTSNAYRLRRPPALLSQGAVGGASAPGGGGASAPPPGAQKGENQEPVELEPSELELPPTPTAATAGEGGRARGTLDFNRGRRRTTAPPDPQGEEQPGDHESFQNAAEPTWDERASAAFMAFWDAYPNRAYPENALKVWRRKKLDRISDRVVDGARRYAADPNRREQYTAAPANWLEGGGWDNGPLPKREAQSKAEAEQQHYDGLFSRAAERAAIRDAGALAALEAAPSEPLRQVGGRW